MQTSLCNSKLFILCFVVFFAIIPSIGHTTNIEHVNVGRVVVENQSLRSQQVAGRLALAQVFVKLSGNQKVLQETEISRAVDNYEQFLISSSFLQQSKSLVFEATFSQQKVENLLLASNLSVWASLRPSSVLWLAVENDLNQKLIISQLSDASFTEELNLRAFARGVDVVVPIGDLDDNINLSVYDVWNQYTSKIKQQSIRYSTDYIISANVQKYDQQQALIDLAESEEFYNRTSSPIDEVTNQNEQNELQFSPTQVDITSDALNAHMSKPIAVIQQSLMIDKDIPENTTHKLDYVITHSNPDVSNKIETGRIFGESERDVTLKIIDVYTNMLAKEFALNVRNNVSEEVVQVLFYDVDSLTDYVNLMSLMRTIPAVKDVRLVEQTGAQAILEIKQNVSTTQLKSILVLDERVSANHSTQETAISFRWNGQ